MKGSPSTNAPSPKEGSGGGGAAGGGPGSERPPSALVRGVHGGQFFRVNEINDLVVDIYQILGNAHSIRVRRTAPVVGPELPFVRASTAAFTHWKALAGSLWRTRRSHVSLLLRKLHPQRRNQDLCLEPWPSSAPRTQTGRGVWVRCHPRMDRRKLEPVLRRNVASHPEDQAFRILCRRSFGA